MHSIEFLSLYVILSVIILCSFIVQYETSELAPEIAIIFLNTEHQLYFNLSYLSQSIAVVGVLL